MSLIGRFFGSRDDVPEWACFFAPEDYREFVARVEGEMKRRGLRYELGDGTLRVHEGKGEPSDYGLLNLAQLCNATERAEWARTVTEHFDSALGAGADAGDLEALAGSLETAGPALKVRLYHPDYLAQIGADRLIHRIPAEGLVETLVYDLPGSVRTVPPEHARRWGRPDGELFRRGLANVRAEASPARQTFDLDRGTRFHALVGDSFFVASHALFLEEYLGPPTEFGALVSVPHRHAVLYHAIADMRVVVAVSSMIPVTFGMYQEGPGSVSAGIYWWREGRLTHLPTQVTAKSVSFTPPDAFVDEVLDRVPEP